VTPPEGCIIAGQHVPGNTYVSVHGWSAYHSTLNFIRRYSFIPQRWLGDEEFDADNRNDVQPFNVGPRNYIGSTMALAEMKYYIPAKLIWGFKMSILEESMRWMEGQKTYMIFEKKPLWVKLRPVIRNL